MKDLSVFSSWDKMIRIISQQQMMMQKITAYNLISSSIPKTLVTPLSLYNQNHQGLTGLSKLLSNSVYQNIQKNYISGSPFFSTLKSTHEILKVASKSNQLSSILSLSTSLNKTPFIFKYYEAIPRLVITGLSGYLSTISKNAASGEYQFQKDSIIEEINDLSNSFSSNNKTINEKIEGIETILLRIEESLNSRNFELHETSESLLSYNRILDYIHLILVIVIFLLAEINSDKRQEAIIEKAELNQEVITEHLDALHEKMDSIYTQLLSKQLAACQVQSILKLNPKKKSLQLFKIKPGQIVEIIDDQKKWIKIYFVDDLTSKKHIGWVLKKNFKKYSN
jgi:hypothetical protein